MQAVVLADDQDYLSWLQQAAGDSLRLEAVSDASPAALLQRLEANPPDLIFVEFTARNSAQRAALLERVQERHWLTPVVGLAAEENAEWVLAAMRAGARDFFVRGRDDATLSAQLARLMRRTAAPARASTAGTASAGRVFAVLGGQPHEGIAFLAEHLALALTETLKPGERSILLDLSTPAGAAAIFLNLNQSYTVLDAIRDARRCDQTLVETAFIRHGSGLYVLSLPEDLLGRPEFDIDEALQLVEVLRGLFAYTVVAVDGHLPLQGLAGLITRADRTVLLSDQSILKSRHTKYLLRALRLEECPLDRTGLVVDNYRRRLGLEPRNLAELFELPLLATLTDENYNRLVSMNSGEPLFTLAKKDPYCLGVRQLVDILQSGRSTAAESGRGLFTRWFGVGNP